jgi:hypothetical protein
MADAQVKFFIIDRDSFDIEAEPGKEQLFSFRCPKHNRRCGDLALHGRTGWKHDPQGQNGGSPHWTWDGNRDKPTFSPSINCGSCWHGYIRDGRTVDCGGKDEP